MTLSGSLVADAAAYAYTDAAIDQATALLRERHSLSYQDNNFTMITQEDLVASFGTITGGMRKFVDTLPGLTAAGANGDGGFCSAREGAPARLTSKRIDGSSWGNTSACGCRSRRSPGGNTW